MLYSHFTRFSLRCFRSRRLSTLQHLDQQHCFFSSSSVVVVGCSAYTSSKASSIVSSLINNSCSYLLPREKKFLLRPFSSSCLSSDQALAEKQHLMEVLDMVSDWEGKFEPAVTTTSCREVSINEWKNGPFVFKIIDKLGAKKITLEGECDGSESIQVVANLPQDGHAYYERSMKLVASVVDKADQRRSEYGIQAKSIMDDFDCYCSTTPDMSSEDSRLFLEARGIDMSLEIFLRDYLIKKYLREDLIPNIAHGY